MLESGFGFEFSKLDATDRQLLGLIIQIFNAFSLNTFHVTGIAGDPGETVENKAESGPSVRACGTVSVQRVGHGERTRKYGVSLSFKDQCSAPKNSKAVLNWCRQYRQMRTAVSSGDIDTLDPLAYFPLNRLGNK